MQDALMAYFVPRIGKRLLALFLTIVIECAVAWLLGYRKKDEIKAVLFINLMTNPVLNYVLWIFPWMFDWIWPLEGVVVLVEWFLLSFALKQRSWRLLGLSFVMNAASFLGGEIIFDWILRAIKF